MLVKKGQNNKIINLHDKTVIYTSRFVYIHQDSYLHIKIRIYTSRFVYTHQDSYIYIKIRIYTSRFVFIIWLCLTRTGNYQKQNKNVSLVQFRVRHES